MHGSTGQIKQTHGEIIDNQWEKSRYGFEVAGLISVLSCCRHGIDKAIELAHGYCLNFRKVCSFCKFMQNYL